jgi:hypothetical protein
MAQTKRRRQTKHRGNAAGVIETRGRTGRPPTAAEKRGETTKSAKAKRMARYEQPPTWRGAAWRALAAAMLMVAITLLLTHKSGEAFALFPIVLLIYVPISYFTDRWMYERRKRTKAGRANDGKASS